MYCCLFRTLRYVFLFNFIIFLSTIYINAQQFQSLEYLFFLKFDTSMEITCLFRNVCCFLLTCNLSKNWISEIEKSRSSHLEIFCKKGGLRNFAKFTEKQLAPKTLWLLVLILLSQWCKMSRPYLVPVANYWTSTNSAPQKAWFFWSTPYKIEVMITSLIEILELPNFGHIATCTI